ncbi:hypothetical protein LOTGIDRAFT_239165 [Lottia gigantea]|uniref:DUF19 domain-containing protein n=1 Tax=Lottia gigantea TaxID=225164 RepID=V4ATU9_LOTGI|nr:hypothetical protein LOTGIDRAFT_239165 [Lottia gigantea]ESO97196.1 hypothetical protein LOTGIDRAFT_239165 [Lottia gigantea]
MAWKYLIFINFICVCTAQFKCTNLVSELVTCSSNHLSKMPEIAQSLRGTTDFIAAGVVIPYWKTMCEYQSDVKNYFTCSLAKINDCVEDGFEGMFPDSQNMNRGFENACTQLDRIDVGCYQVNQAAIHQCAMSATGPPPTSTSNASAMITHNCRLFSEEIKCTGQNLDTCQDTKKIVENYFSYLGRPACGGVAVVSLSLLLSFFTLCFTFILRH